MRRLAVALALGLSAVCPVGSGDFGGSTGPSAPPLRKSDGAHPHAHHATDPLAWVAMLGAFGLLGVTLRVLGSPQTGVR